MNIIIFVSFTGDHKNTSDDSHEWKYNFHDHSLNRTRAISSGDIARLFIINDGEGHS